MFERGESRKKRGPAFGFFDSKKKITDLNRKICKIDPLKHHLFSYN